ncbi:hypothetical protein N9980_01445 [bacterium]|nr:hypothetical protein [bacterium]
MHESQRLNGTRSRDSPFVKKKEYIENTHGSNVRLASSGWSARRAATEKGAGAMVENGSLVVTPGCRISRSVFLFGFLVLVFLVAPQSAQAQIVRNTVGPDGTFATIQAAVNACPSAVECHVDVEMANIYTENVVFPISHTSGTILVSGGWDATFSSRIENFRASTIDGGATGRVLDIQVSGGTVAIEGFIIENGSDTRGAGINVDPGGASGAIVKLTNLDIRNNHASNTYSCEGGGVRAQLNGSERLEIVNSEISSNSVTVTSESNYAAGGGIYISASGTASFLVDDTWVEENTATSDTAQKEGAGQAFYLEGESSGEIVNMEVTGNTAGGTFDAVTGTGGRLILDDNASLVVRQGVWALNSNLTGDTESQLHIGSYGNATLLVTDTAIVLGDQNGLYSRAWDFSSQRFVNLTVADNALTGINFDLVGGGTTGSVYNSIAYGNGTDVYLAAGIGTGNNLIGVDPIWVAPGPPSYNYRLDQGSPALDAGNNAPPGGLGPLDLDGLPRIQNSNVDIGCYEGAGRLFADGFESGDTGEWSSAVP